jgi:UDP-N-acetylglucosamine:LPS N-acetylglucosamine transferase
MLTALVRRRLPLNVVVVAGKNARLKRQLEVEFDGCTEGTCIVPLGFVTNINELVNAADFCFIKPGPATTWEVLSLRKPILFAASAQLSENPNIRYAVRNRVGRYVGVSPLRFARRVQELMDDAALAEVQRHYDRLNLQNGADDIARFVDKVLSGRVKPAVSPPPSWPARRAPRRRAPGLRPTPAGARASRRAARRRPGSRSPGV